MHQEPICFGPSLEKSKPTWPHTDELKFNAKQQTRDKSDKQASALESDV